ELATAVQEGCRLTVVVFNDSAIAMIGVKQQHRGLARRGMDYSATDFSLVARGYGCEGFRVTQAGQLAATLKQAMACTGPAVVDVLVEPASYVEQIRSLRG